MIGSKGLSVTYYVVFQGGEMLTSKVERITRWLKPEFRHCFAIRDAGDHWVIIEPRTCFLDVFIKPKSLYPHYRDLVNRDAVVVKASSQIDPDRLLMGAGLLSCVEVVKSLLGIKHFFTITPYQLYRGLIEGKYNGKRH